VLKGNFQIKMCSDIYLLFSAASSFTDIASLATTVAFHQFYISGITLQCNRVFYLEAIYSESLCQFSLRQAALEKTRLVFLPVSKPQMRISSLYGFVYASQDQVIVPASWSLSLSKLQSLNF
jgi:hypothetical protein